MTITDTAPSSSYSTLFDWYQHTYQRPASSLSTRARSNLSYRAASPTWLIRVLKVRPGTYLQLVDLDHVSTCTSCSHIHRLDTGYIQAYGQTNDLALPKIVVTNGISECPYDDLDLEDMEWLYAVVYSCHHE